MLEWSEKYSVNIKEIDNQHKKLIRMINDLIEDMNSKSNMTELGNIIAGLNKYVKEHFDTEEKYMVEFNYPGYVTHKTKHKYFIAKVEEFNKEFNNGKMLVSIKIMNFLKKWIVEHILEEDKKYSKLFIEKGLI